MRCGGGVAIQGISIERSERVTDLAYALNVVTTPSMCSECRGDSSGVHGVSAAVAG